MVEAQHRKNNIPYTLKKAFWKQLGVYDNSPKFSFLSALVFVSILTSFVAPFNVTRLMSLFSAAMTFPSSSSVSIVIFNLHFLYSILFFVITIFAYFHVLLCFSTNVVHRNTKIAYIYPCCMFLLTYHI